MESTIFSERSRSAMTRNNMFLTCLLRNQKKQQQVFFKKNYLKNFAKFTGKHLCLSLFFNKVAGPGLQLY